MKKEKRDGRRPPDAEERIRRARRVLLPLYQEWARRKGADNA